MNNLKCYCRGFRENFNEILYILLSIRLEGFKYRGEPFKFCPWCGKVLIRRQNELEKLVNNKLNFNKEETE